MGTLEFLESVQEFRALPTDESGFTPPASFGPYRVLHQIGSGVLGPVFRTYDPQHDRLVAVKAFRLDLVPEDVARMAASLKKLAGKSIDDGRLVKVIDAGVEEGIPFIASEYVSAETLDVALRHLAPAPLDRALPMLVDLAEAIENGWAAGIGHGTMHPRDIFVASGTHDVRITGFGVGQALESAGAKVPGRRPYSAPERTGEGKWDIRADVYSLGVIAHELLTKRRPGGADADASLVTGTSPEQRRLIRAVVAAALAESPEHRFATPKALTDALAAVSRGEAPVLPAGAPEPEAKPAAELKPVAEVKPIAAPKPEPPAPKAAPSSPLLPGLEPKAPEPTIKMSPMASVPTAPPEIVPPPPAPAPAPPPPPKPEPVAEAKQPPKPEAPKAEPTIKIDKPPAPPPFDSPRSGERDSLMAGPTVPSTPAPVKPAAPAPVVSASEPTVKMTPAPPKPAISAAPAPAMKPAATEPVVIRRVPEPSHPPAPGPELFHHDEPSSGPSWGVIGAIVVAAIAVAFVSGVYMGRTYLAPSGAATTATQSTADQTPKIPAGTDVAVPPANPVPAPVPTTSSSSSSTSAPPPVPAETSSGARQAEPPPTSTPKPTPPPKPTPAPAAEKPAAKPPVRSATPPASAATKPAAGATAAAATGSVFVDSRPAGARIFLDNKEVGRTPFTIKDVKPGKHPLRFEMPGYQTLSTSVDVRSGKQERVTVTLELAFPLPKVHPSK